MGLLIFSIIAAGLYNVFAVGIKLNHKAQQMHQALSEIRFTMDRIVSDMENIVPYDFSNSYPNMTAFSGEPHSISFLVASDTGLKVVSYFAAEPEEGHIRATTIGRRTDKNVTVTTGEENGPQTEDLLREEVPLLEYWQTTGATHEIKLGERTSRNVTVVLGEVEADFRPLQSGARELLSPHLKRDGLKFSFGFVDPKDQTKTVFWESQWSKKYLPFGVRVEATFLNPEKGGPEIVVKRDLIVPVGFWGREDADSL